ncbi:hypothetical protein QOL99_17385, partial [Deinococcus sp. MIMF12]
HVYDDQRAQAALSLETLLAPVRGSRVQARPGSPGEWHEGRASLERLHAALGAFLAEAPEWARQVVRAGLEDL